MNNQLGLITDVKLFFGGTFMGAAEKHEVLVEVWNSLKSTSVQDGVIKEISKQHNITEKVAAVSISILKKVACSGTFEDFVNYIETKELPALRLTSSEMEAVKGGMIYPGFGALSDLAKFIKNSTRLIP